MSQDCFGAYCHDHNMTPYDIIIFSPRDEKQESPSYSPNDEERGDNLDLQSLLI